MNATTDTTATLKGRSVVRGGHAFWTLRMSEPVHGVAGTAAITVDVDRKARTAEVSISVLDIPGGMPFFQVYALEMEVSETRATFRTDRYGYTRNVGSRITKAVAYVPAVAEWGAGEGRTLNDAAQDWASQRASTVLRNLLRRAALKAEEATN